MNELRSREDTYSRFTSIDHSKTLIGHFQDAALRDRRILQGVAKDSPHRLTNHSSTFVRQGLHRTQVTQKISLSLYFGRGRIEIAVVHVDRISWRKDTLPACPQIHA